MSGDKPGTVCRADFRCPCRDNLTPGTAYTNRMAADKLLCYIDLKPKRAKNFDSPVIFEDALKGYSTHLHYRDRKGEPRETKKMKFDKEMDQFFIRNCYSEREREQVRVWPAYQLARDKNDPTEGQEIATQFLETKANERTAARQTL